MRYLIQYNKKKVVLQNSVGFHCLLSSSVYMSFSTKCHQSAIIHHYFSYYIKQNQMKRKIFFIMMLSFCSISMEAQSNMTDEQVMRTDAKEHEKGSSNSQIVTKLMQSGVDINQIRRVRKRYESLQKESQLGSNTSQVKSDDSRLRKNNGKTRSDYQNDVTNNNSNYRIQAQRNDDGNDTYDADNEDYQNMQDEMYGIYPDSTEMLKRFLAQEKKKKNKGFGRDIFNNKELSFEPNMNIATPQNYRLGPGDAVYIDIYGASQKTIESTVSPDGTVTIDGFGPVSVSGLTVAQANSRLRSQIGAKYQSSNIRLTVGQTRTIIVNIKGKVKTPGTYTLSAFASVFNALYMAGGTNEIGTLRNIRIYRKGKLISTCDIYDYILNGNMKGNVRLTSGDVIIVEPYECLVQ